MLNKTSDTEGARVLDGLRTHPLHRAPDADINASDIAPLKKNPVCPIFLKPKIHHSVVRLWVEREECHEH